MLLVPFTMAFSVSSSSNLSSKASTPIYDQLCKNSIFPKHTTVNGKKSNLYSLLVLSSTSTVEGERSVAKEEELEKPKFRWVRKDAILTEEQKQVLSKLPLKMTNRCKVLMKQIICFSTENESSVSPMLAAWVKGTKPQRADWLSVLKELERLHHPLYFEVSHSLIANCFLVLDSIFSRYCSLPC